VGVGEYFGRVWKIIFKTKIYGKFDILLPCGAKGVSHGEAGTWFESAQNFVARSAYDKGQPTPCDNDKVLLQHQETKGD